jgi:hypothetical protein
MVERQTSEPGCRLASMSERERALGVAITIAALLVAPLVAAAADSEGDPPLVTLRGRVVCSGDARGEDAPAEDPCERPDAHYGLWVSPSETVHFLADDPRAAIFTDAAVRERELEVSGWRRPNDGFEILSVHSIIDGKAHHLHYRCDVCNITATAPGPCWCCGAPFELREVPVDSATDMPHAPATPPGG